MCTLVSRRCFHFMCWITAFQYSWKDSVDWVQLISQSLKGPVITNGGSMVRAKIHNPNLKKGVFTFSAYHLSTIPILSILTFLFSLAPFSSNQSCAISTNESFHCLPNCVSENPIAAPGQDWPSLNSIMNK